MYGQVNLKTFRRKLMDIKELQKRILEEKKRSGTVILAHTYQSPDIIEIASVLVHPVVFGQLPALVVVGPLPDASWNPACSP